ncbi:hypothetical protein BGX38DRAFT_1146798 [Terfezia claveryi]|nr:hypothetical protein BGX38DRAFT_1146798 [Terfezia claveryi]
MLELNLSLVVSMRKDTKGTVKNEDYLKLTGQQQIWVRRRAQSWDSGGQLNSWTIARVEGLFKIWDRMQGTHEVAYVRLLRIKGSSRLHSEEGMIQMEKCEDDRAMQVIGISDIEGMAHVIPLEIDRVWSQMYRM